MTDILRNKKMTTRFQILVEIADKGPYIQQRSIARQLDLTPQAVSEYISSLLKEKLLQAEGRSQYRLTGEAVDWIIKELRELDDYNSRVQKAINNIAVCPAIAENGLQAGQAVSLKMHDGLLYASARSGSGATGLSISGAVPGQDVGITGIKGIIPLEVGMVTIFRIPGVGEGGSDRVDYTGLKDCLKKYSPVFSLGLEAYVALIKLDANFQYYGVKEAAVEAARSGLNPLVVCVGNETSGLVVRLTEGGIHYRIIDA